MKTKTREEIADECGISIPTVRWRMSRLGIKPCEYVGEPGRQVAHYSLKDALACKKFQGKKAGRPKRDVAFQYQPAPPSDYRPGGTDGR